MLKELVGKRLTCFNSNKNVFIVSSYFDRGNKSKTEHLKAQKRLLDAEIISEDGFKNMKSKI